MNNSSLSRSLLASLSEASHDINRCTSLNELSRYASERFFGLVRSEVVIWNEVAMNGEVLSVRTFPELDAGFLSRQCAAFAAYAPQHPCFADFVQRRPEHAIQSISSLGSLAKFQETDMYAAHNRNLSGRDQISLVARANPAACFAFSLYRSTRYKETEKAVATLGLGFVLSAYRRLGAIQDLESRLLAAMRPPTLDSAWIETDSRLQPFAASRNLQAFLTKRLGEGIRALALPVALKSALQSEIGEERLSGKSVTELKLSFRIPLEAGGIAGRASLDRLRDHVRIELEDEDAATVRLQELLKGMTPARKSVLRWALAGKTNPEIAAILGIRSGTVEKHVSGLLQRFGAASRAELIRMHPVFDRNLLHAPC